MKRSYLKRSNKPMKKIGRRAKRVSPQMVRWQREVRERDGYTCQFPGCGYFSKHIDTHHVAKRSQRPDLVFDVSNGVCLCRQHHDWTDQNHDEAVNLKLLSTHSYELAQKESRL